jgi:hypothetical protein
LVGSCSIISYCCLFFMHIFIYFQRTVPFCDIRKYSCIFTIVSLADKRTFDSVGDTQTTATLQALIHQTMRVQLSPEHSSNGNSSGYTVICVVNRNPPSNSKSRKHATHCPSGGRGHAPVNTPSARARNAVGLYATRCGAGLPGVGFGEGSAS